MRQNICVAFLVTLATMAAAGDDCRPEKDEAKPWECCKMGENKAIPDSFGDSVKKCMGKNPPPPKAKGPPSEAAMKEMHQAMECAAECVFGENELLSADKKSVDKSAATKAFTEVVAGDKEMETMMAATLDKCFASYKSEVEPSAKCKSGAMQFEKCIMREGFLNCPRSMWNSSDDCGKLKAKVTKCPKMPVMLMPPPPQA